VNTVACRAFAVFWWLLHAYAVTMMVIAMHGKRMLVEDPMASLWGIGWFPAHRVASLSGIGWFIALPLVILLLLRWTITGRWRFGPRW
jgi:hypothetical protein